MKTDEVLEFYDDTVENFDSLNNKFRETSDWINPKMNLLDNIELNKNNLKPDDIFKLLSINDSNNSEITFENKYICRETDPLLRINGIKSELTDCIKEIDLFVDLFKTNNFIVSKENLPKVYEDIKLYKSKLDSFLNYKVFESKQKNDESGSIHNESNISLSEVKLKSLNESNDILTKNLIEKVKIIEENMQTSKDDSMTVQYKIYASPEFELETLSGKLNNLDLELTNLERIIGDWSLVS